MTAVGVQENSAQETAYRAKRQRTITAVQECWLEEGAVVPVLRRLTAELGPYEDPAETGAFAVVTHMSEAFCIRLVFAAKFTRWHAIGGDLSDEETEKRFEGPAGRGAARLAGSCADCAGRPRPDCVP
ncbi:hypothetical protein [Streptomyces sp. NPDC059979]|uniref:hypothetical protein n=1 Tax=Streptomyces sp. NPDC059979 TaxID=3347021 RepID=UPI003676C36F